MSCTLNLKAMQDYDGIMRGFEAVDHFKRLNIKSINWEKLMRKKIQPIVDGKLFIYRANF